MLNIKKQFEDIDKLLKKLPVGIINDSAIEKLKNRKKFLEDILNGEVLSGKGIPQYKLNEEVKKYLVGDGYTIDLVIKNYTYDGFMVAKASKGGSKYVIRSISPDDQYRKYMPETFESMNKFLSEHKKEMPFFDSEVVLIADRKDFFLIIEKDIGAYDEDIKFWKRIRFENRKLFISLMLQISSAVEFLEFNGINHNDFYYKNILFLDTDKVSVSVNTGKNKYDIPLFGKQIYIIDYEGAFGKNIINHRYDKEVMALQARSVSERIKDEFYIGKDMNKFLGKFLVLSAFPDDIVKVIDGIVMENDYVEGPNRDFYKHIIYSDNEKTSGENVYALFKKLI